LFPKLGLHTGQQSGPKLLVPQSLSAVHPSSIFGGALTTLAADFGSEVAVAIGSGAADAAAGSRMWQLTTTIATQSTWRQKMIPLRVESNFAHGTRMGLSPAA
jgi:hypothetical protein